MVRVSDPPALRLCDLQVDYHQREGFGSGAKPLFSDVVHETSRSGPVLARRTLLRFIFSLAAAAAASLSGVPEQLPGDVPVADRPGEGLLKGGLNLCATQLRCESFEQRRGLPTR